MQPASLDEIRDKAQQLQDAHQAWHIHILSPQCVFNSNQQFALVLESTDEQLTLVNYADEAQKALGKELLVLRYGNKMLDKSVGSDSTPAEKVQTMIEQAGAWNKAGVVWHHHMLMPDCRFNQHQPQYVLMLEDNDGTKTFESLSEKEPVQDLAQIERLFYKP